VGATTAPVGSGCCVGSGGTAVRVGVRVAGGGNDGVAAPVGIAGASRVVQAVIKTTKSILVQYRKKRFFIQKSVKVYWEAPDCERSPNDALHLVSEG